MRPRLLLALLLASSACTSAHAAAVVPPAAPATPALPDEAITVLRDSVVRGYAAYVFDQYAQSRVAADRMKAAVNAFCASPTEEGLARARENWIDGRRIYGRTEVFRFGDGPIDSMRGGTETLINAWPVDEAYLDAVPGAAAPGIIANPAKYPVIAGIILRQLNQRGGETNVCTGWHAIEFLLWGQDFSETGPGARPASDFMDGQAEFAERRRDFLRETTGMLCQDLVRLEEAWKPDADNHRRRFVADPDKALRSILTGVALLTGFEMSGERLAVPYETRDQEEEHSCFSDTTHIDFLANIEGVAAVLRGHQAPGVIDLVRAKDPAQGQRLAEATDAAVAAVQAMPVPFDAGIRAADETPERRNLLAAIEALEALGEQVSSSARLFGYFLPTEPQG